MSWPGSGFDFFTQARELLERSARENDPRRIRRLPAITVRADAVEPDAIDAPLRALLNLGAPVAQSGLDATAGVARGIASAARRLGLPGGDAAEQVDQSATRARQRMEDVMAERMAPRSKVDQAARFVGSAALPVAAAVANPVAGLAVTGAMSAGNRNQSGTAALADLTGSETLRALSDKTVTRAAADVALDRVADVALPLAVGSLKKVSGSAKGLPKSYDDLLREQKIGQQTLRDVDEETLTNARGDGPLFSKTTLQLDPTGEGIIRDIETKLIAEGQRKTVVPDAEVFKRSLGVDLNAVMRSGRVKMTTEELAATGQFVDAAQRRAEELVPLIEAEADPVRRAALNEEFDQVFGALSNVAGRFEKAKSEQGRGLRILSRFAAQRGDPQWALATARRLTKTDDLPPAAEDAVRKTFRENPVPPDPRTRPADLPPDAPTPEVTAESLDAFNQALDRRALALARTFQEIQKGSPLDVALSVRRAGMLTAPVTHLVNTISGGVNTLNNEVAHPLAAALDRVYSAARNQPRSVMVTRERFAGRAAGAKEGLRKSLTADRFLRGIDVEDPFAALSQERINYVNSLGLAPKDGEGAFRKSLRGGAQALQVVSDVVYGTMNVPDQTLFTSAMRASLAERAVLRAQREGLTRTSPEFATRVQELASPKGASIDDVLFATEEALNETFKSRTVLGDLIGRGHSNKSSVVRVMSHVLAPFGKTPANLLNTTIDMTPGAGLARNLATSGDMQERAFKELTAGDRMDDASAKASVDLERRRRFMLSLAKQGNGAALLTLGAYLASDGLMSGPYQPGSAGTDIAGDRDLADVPPGMVKTPSGWMSLLPLGPQGVLLNMGAAIYQQIQQDNATTMGDRVSSGTTAAVSGGLQQLMELPMVQGIKDVDELRRAGASGLGRRAGEYATRQAASFIPAGSAIATTARAIDPVRDRRPEGAADVVRERLPGLREQVPEKLSLFGEASPNPGALRTVLDPFRTRPGRDSDPTIAWAMQQNIRVPRADKKGAESIAVYNLRRKADGPLEKRILDAMFESGKDEWADGQVAFLVKSDGVAALLSAGRKAEAAELAMRNYRSSLTRSRAKGDMTIGEAL